jgi:hypothetical protein
LGTTSFLPTLYRCTAVPQTEEEFDAAKAATVRQLRQAALAASAPFLPDYLALERRLTRVVDKALPPDHPHRATAQQKIAAIQVGGGVGAEARSGGMERAAVDVLLICLLAALRPPDDC